MCLGCFLGVYLRKTVLLICGLVSSGLVGYLASGIILIEAGVSIGR